MTETGHLTDLAAAHLGHHAARLAHARLRGLEVRRTRLDFGFGPFGGRSEANPPAFGAMPQHLPLVEYFIPFRL